MTYGHHALIAGKRVKAIYSIFLTILLALVFTGLQAFEYHESSFSMSDSVFGSTFFASTGLHGLTLVAPTKNINSKFKSIHLLYLLQKKSINKFSTIHANKLIVESNKKSINLEKNFLEWFSGFTDAEGNFNISLRNLNNNNNYNSIIITFQIGLPIKDLLLLKFIKNKLNCGHISISRK